MQFRRGKPYRDDDNGGRLVAVWYVGGERYRERTPFTSEAEVEELLRQKESQYYQSRGVWRGQDAKVALGAAVMKFLKAKATKKRSTLRQYNLVLENFRAFAGDSRHLDSLTSVDVDQFIEAHAKTGVAPATLQSDIRVLKAFGNWCSKRGLMFRSFTDGVEKIRAPRNRPRFLSPEQVDPFLKACSPTFRPIALFMILTGLRRVEVVNAKWKDIETDPSGHSALWAKGAKTGDDRCVPIHPVLMAELNKLPRISEHIFPVTRSSHPPSGRVRIGQKRSDETAWFNKAVKEAANKAGLDPGRLDVHALRKTFARLCQRACGDLWLTSKMMGHTEVNTTDRHYLFADTEREREAINAIPITPLPDDGPKSDPNGGTKTRKGRQDNVIRLAERKRVHCHNSATVRWSDGKRAPEDLGNQLK